MSSPDHHRHRRHRRRPRRPGRQQAAHRRRPRPRRPRPRTRGRALAHRALGLPAPADPELDDAAARLELRGPRPRRVPRQPASSSTTSRRYAASFGAPVSGGTTVEEVRVSGRGGSRYAVATDRGTWRPTTSSSRPGPTAAPHCRPVWTRGDVITSSEYRNPAQLPDGGVLVVGASSSGVQIADELDRAGRKVVLAVGRHTRMPAPLPRHGHLLVAGGHRTPGPHHRRDAPTRSLRGASRRSSWSAATTPSGRRPTSTWRCSSPEACGWPAGSRRVHGRRPSSVTTWPQRWRRRAGHAPVARRASTRFVERAGLPAEVWPGDRPAPVRCRGAARPASTCARRGSARSSLATGFRPHHPWLRLPITGPDGASVSAAASPRRPASTPWASGSSTGATQA